MIDGVNVISNLIQSFVIGGAVVLAFWLFGNKINKK